MFGVMLALAFLGFVIFERVESKVRRIKKLAKKRQEMAARKTRETQPLLQPDIDDPTDSHLN